MNNFPHIPRNSSLAEFMRVQVVVLLQNLYYQLVPSILEPITSRRAPVIRGHTCGTNRELSCCVVIYNGIRITSSGIRLKDISMSRARDQL
ncbi:hypothetical protein TNIN_51271 [Trichonephila inaurata madagascariensis]|uniref:Uncharacterized protein n=1 Tax=Trichonephila inaurata madagascariensis TaxID=2747483 RepID=A0A8X7BUU7_9ARAC|nr:hypothetical protein TNIN_51271 [Trichonephila inaurata madagascariensis]